MKALDTGRNYWNGVKLTQEDMENVDNLLDKMVLYRIMYKRLEEGEKEFRYHWTAGFIDHMNIMGEQLREDPKLEEIYEGANPDQTNFNITLHVILRYLATNRVAERRLAGLPEWEKRSTSQEYSLDEINVETEKLMDGGHGFYEIYDMARMVYGMLRYDAVTSEGKFFKLNKK